MVFGEEAFSVADQSFAKKISVDVNQRPNWSSQWNPGVAMGLYQQTHGQLGLKETETIGQNEGRLQTCTILQHKGEIDHESNSWVFMGLRWVFDGHQGHRLSFNKPARAMGVGSPKASGQGHSEPWGHDFHGKIE